MQTVTSDSVALGFIAVVACAGLAVGVQTLRHLRRAARKAAQRIWSLHCSAAAAPGARGNLFYVRLADPARNRFTLSYVKVRSPAGAGASAVAFRPYGPSGEGGGHTHVTFKRMLSLNQEIVARRAYEPAASEAAPAGEGRVYFFVTPRPGTLWRRRLPERLVVDVAVEEISPEREVHRLTLTSEPVAWARDPAA
ncbi:hypothetical protein OPKNFCMD_1084 [Methylobacterium crusticola]|uniref:DUF3592 domain-containing protein n=1 Tax=Methylobacterium crusticola TaxID=1697972 RepID=A0ABQ4QUL2_9HYPH|nr:hypothetical protein [Methylobacterium crusticola]GJD48366.1 hypothetical protein OPKNFCMD_1084 [Methylobacterium crusticola]